MRPRRGEAPRPGSAPGARPPAQLTSAPAVPGCAAPRSRLTAAPAPRPVLGSRRGRAPPPPPPPHCRFPLPVPAPPRSPSPALRARRGREPRAASAAGPAAGPAHLQRRAGPARLSRPLPEPPGSLRTRVHTHTHAHSYIVNACAGIDPTPHPSILAPSNARAHTRTHSQSSTKSKPVCPHQGPADIHTKQGLTHPPTHVHTPVRISRVQISIQTHTSTSAHYSHLNSHVAQEMSPQMTIHTQTPTANPLPSLTEQSLLPTPTPASFLETAGKTHL